MSINPSSNNTRPNTANLLAQAKTLAAKLGMKLMPNQDILRAHKNATQGKRASKHVGSSRRLSDFEEIQACEMRRKGLSVQFISDTLSISRQAVYDALARNGLHTIGAGHGQRAHVSA